MAFSSKRMWHFLRRYVSSMRTFILLKRTSNRNHNFTGELICPVYNTSRKRFLSKIYAVCLIPVVQAALVTEGKNESSSKEENEVIKEADEFYSQNEVEKPYEHLKLFQNSTNADIIWRLARATCDKAKSTSDKELKKSLMYEAFGYAQQALQLGADSNFACHKWYAIMLDYIGEYEGTKERISKAFHIKEHFLKAIELNKRDATSIHALGYWCFVFADLPWYQQKIASVLFTTPPTATYQESLDYFLEAEKIDPGFYSMNLLMIGKTYLRLKEMNLAHEYLIKARDYPVRREDDKRAHAEATELLINIEKK